jgi:AcrR family transcriptional regulator
MAGSSTARPTRPARREQLLDAAERALRRDGPDASMEALATEAGITKPVLYRHFGDRDGLVAAVARRHADRLTGELRTALGREQQARDRIRTTVDTYLAFLERDPELHRVVRRSGRADRPGAASALEDALDVVCDEVVTTVERELIAAHRDPTPARTWGQGIVGMVQLVGDRWVERRDVPRAALVDRLADLLWHGFRGTVRADRDVDRVLDPGGPDLPPDAGPELDDA